MKQFVVALLAAFALSLPAFAGSINYDTGNFEKGKITGSFNSQISIDITGTLHEIDLSTGKLTENMSGCPTGATCFDFSGGSISVDHGVFKDAVSGGIVITSSGVGTISAILAAESGVASGGATATFSFDGTQLLAGSEDVSVNSTPVPEPTALYLLGMGLVPLVFLRRKHAE